MIPIVQGGPGSVRFGYGLGMERFERFRFSVPAVPLRRGFLCVSVQSHREDGSGSGFGSWKMVPAVPVSGFWFGSWATLIVCVKATGLQNIGLAKHRF